ncbi:hypothetical protein F7R20_05515 [Pseudomonas brassicacearum subsp. brassicacearum]|nr:hypothetical protein F7R20_05515 [Pseudomonas brassicacearum subsp. brassicacearum]PJH90196.1 hypothetical protein CVG87_05890 [Pseudomonas sp. WCS365]QEO77724.1 hypothetical protein ELZ14_09210 [Pseudomonas brassicacearum]
MGASFHRRKAGGIQILKSYQNQCGSELARDWGVSGNIHAADTPQSRASSLPQVFASGLYLT